MMKLRICSFLSTSCLATARNAWRLCFQGHGRTSEVLHGLLFMHSEATELSKVIDLKRVEEHSGIELTPTSFGYVSLRKYTALYSINITID